MIDSLQFIFSHRFDGVIWNSLAGDEILIIEARNLLKKQVTFSALNFHEGVFLWKERVLEESWWVNASALVNGMILFTIYLDTNNPDKKGTLAYSVANLELVWWNNDFSIIEVGRHFVKGQSSKYGLKDIYLDSKTGNEIRPVNFEPGFAGKGATKPVQYTEGTGYFETVKTFLSEKLNLHPVSALEYLETEENIIISCYIQSRNETQLANYLIVLSKAGEVLLKETLDPAANGIGLETFYTIDGLLFFVKDKVELVIYKI